MQGVGRVLAVDVPAPRCEPVAHGEDVEAGLIRGDRQDLVCRVAPQYQAVDGPDPVPDAVGGVERAPNEAAVAVGAEVGDDGPGGRHRESRPGPLEVRRGVEPAQPVVEHEGLVAAELPRGVEQDRDPLGCVAQLVDVG